MAIPATPYNFNLQQGNRQVFLSWDIAVGATSYSIQRSLDGVTYTTYATISVNNYLDTVVSSGILYYYQIASINISGTSPYTDPLSIVPSPTSEMSLGQIRLMAQQKSDRVNSDFVTVPEWNNFINLAMYELYDLLITADEEYFVATPIRFMTNGTDYLYPLPDGLLTYSNGIDNSPNYVGEPFYKLKGVDLGLSTATNAWVTLNKFNFISRNRYLYPNASSTIYGVFNCQYRLLGSNIEFIPVPSANQPIRLWYIPRLKQLLQDTDISTLGFSGWLAYVITRAAKYALDKEESDTSKLDSELVYLKMRIEETSTNRDTAMPDTISDTRNTGGMWGNGGGFNGPIGGY